MALSYARSRNTDFGPGRRPNVSCLSPWIRHRLISEQEVVSAALKAHSFDQAEKFIQEVCWRTYFKGWLEQRPQVWTAYCADRDAALETLESHEAMLAEYNAAIEGRTGIEGFDDWAKELVSTGYLHNHARMWFASIWIFTLRLPWELGADFFLRYLIDGDAASNTLSWRWVAGLHTKGKTYLARRSNIETYTDGRFCPTGLASEAHPIKGYENPDRQPLRAGEPVPTEPFILLLTEDDLTPEQLLPETARVEGVLGIASPISRSPRRIGGAALRFATISVANTTQRVADHFGVSGETVEEAGQLAAVAKELTGDKRVRTIAMPHMPIGWTKDALSPHLNDLRKNGYRIAQIRRPWDNAFWPHARAGYFRLKKTIPENLRSLGLPV